MTARSAVVVSMDRLGAAWLGPYGNTWLPTPHFDRLASQSLLCETVLADSPNCGEACKAWWAAAHSLAGGAVPLPEALPQLASRSGAESVLVTDDTTIAAHPLAACFRHHVVIEQPRVTSAAADPTQTGLVHLASAAAEQLTELGRPFLLWIHGRGMAGPWDAPQEMREQFADEEDPRPPEFVAPPERMLAPDYDPDELLGLVHAYAAQVVIADLALGLLLEALDAHSQRDQTLLAVTSPRGYPLGEHRRVGPCDEALYGELINVPLLVRMPKGEGRLMRSQQIVQPHDLYYLLGEATGWSAGSASSLLAEIEGRSFTPREAALCSAAPERAIRTPAWYLRRSLNGEVPAYELYAKPDDRFEVNEISTRCPEVVELLAELLDCPLPGADAQRLTHLSPLPELLTNVWR